METHPPSLDYPEANLNKPLLDNLTTGQVPGFKAFPSCLPVPAMSPPARNNPRYPLACKKHTLSPHAPHYYPPLSLLPPPSQPPLTPPPRSNYQTPDSKKEEFRKYLEKSGVIDALTKVLVGLYEEPERPPNAVDYIKRYMGAPTGVDVEALRIENEELKKEVGELRATQEEMSQRLREAEEADS